MKGQGGQDMAEARWPSAAVFDFDGLLVDTADCWHRAFANSLALRGQTLDPGVLPALAGASVTQAAVMLGVAAVDLRAQLSQAFRQMRPALMLGALEIIDTLRQRVPLAIATNAPAELVEWTLSDVGLAETFSLIVSAETLRYPEKPAPDVYAATCNKLAVDPSAAIAFEDSAIGVLSAHQAGLTVVYVPSDGQITDHADLEVDHLGDPRLLAFLGDR